MEIGRVEIGDTRQRGPVHDRHRPATARYQPALAQRLQGAVDVDRGEPGRIGDLLLRHRQLITGCLTQSGDLEPEGELTEKVSDAGVSVAQKPEPAKSGASRGASR